MADLSASPFWSPQGIATRDADPQAHDTLTHGIAAAFTVGAIFTAVAVVIATLIVKKIRA